MCYGVLVGCCRQPDGNNWCIIRGLQEIVSPLGQQLTDECDCPLFELTHILFLRTSSSVVKPVSMVHQCSSSCKFTIKEIPRNVERETVNGSRIEYEHDFVGSLLYCLNIYCMGT